MKKLLLASTAAIAPATSPALAHSTTDQIVADPQSRGFTYVEVRQGPSQIKAEAVRDGTKLEVIHDSATGEILKKETEAAECDYATRTGIALRRAHRRTARVEAQLRAASGAFMDLMQERFAQWGLTAAERDVALFSIKGLSTAEIAAMRDTSEGTVKAQTNAIYRKAGVSGRPQLLGLFIEDLMDGPVTGRPARIAEEPPAARSPAPADASPPG
jgi:DNA-binding CsgD family transcriptional regulator